MNNTEYLNEHLKTIKTERLKRIVKNSASSSSEFSSNHKKRPSSKSTSRSKRREHVKIEIKPAIRDISIKAVPKHFNRSTSSRNMGKYKFP